MVKHNPLNAWPAKEAAGIKLAARSKQTGMAAHHAQRFRAYIHGHRYIAELNHAG